MNEIERTEKNLPMKPEREPGQYPTRTEKKKNGSMITAIVLFLAMGVATTFLARGVIRNGAQALYDSFHTAFETEKDDAYTAQYDKYYELAEQEYHVKNRATISIGDLQETAALEVLTVSDIEYIIEQREDNKNGIASWLAVPGYGTYVVDLQAAEFIVDSERDYVLVRAPYPEITNIKIDYKNAEKLLFQNNLFNDSYSVGEDLARSQFGAADLLIKKEFASNQSFYLNAQEAAVSTIQSLVMQLNPEVPELTVDVEFY